MKVYRANLNQLEREIAIFQSLLRTCPEYQIQQVYMTLASLRAELIDLMSRRLTKYGKVA